MKRILSLVLCAGMVLIGGSGCGKSAKDTPYQKTNIAMGTMVTQTIYAEGADELASHIDILLQQLETEELSYRLPDSKVSKINQSLGNGETPVIQAPLDTYIQDCLKLWEQSDGALDITLGKVVSLWNIDTYSANGGEGFEVPSKEAIEEALSQAGMEKIHLQNNLVPQDDQTTQQNSQPSSQFTFDGPVSLDLGAVGKGIALDRIHDVLMEGGASAAIIQVGGSVLTYGEKPNGQPFKVAVVNPLDTGKQLGYLSLKGQWCVSTSGDYERYVEKDGVRYHHILDPKTGYPVDNELCSVTILAKNGFLSDALSTACFVCGTKTGMELAKACEVEALFVNKNGELTMTEGMQKIFVENKQ